MSINKTSLLAGIAAGLAGYSLFRQRYVPVVFRDVKPWAIVPTRSTNHAAGYDIALPKDITIEPGETKVVNLGFNVSVPSSHYVSLQTRSSKSIKEGLVLANGTEGVIDCDYRDSLKLALYNRSEKTLSYSRGTNVAQMIYKRYDVAIEVSEPAFRTFFDVRNNNRIGGIGSTDSPK